MKDAHHRAVYPALATHKGTLVRLTLELLDDTKVVIEPLHFPAGALVLCKEGLQLFGRPTPTEDGLFLLDLEANPIRRIDIDRAIIANITTFVLYPNGFTFSGRILDRERLQRLNALVWSTDVARRVKTPVADELFKFSADWPDVPTVIGLPSKELLDKIKLPPDLDRIERVAACRYIEHSCPSQCNDRTKRISREGGEHVL